MVVSIMIRRALNFVLDWRPAVLFVTLFHVFPDSSHSDHCHFRTLIIYVVQNVVEYIVVLVVVRVHLFLARQPAPQWTTAYSFTRFLDHTTTHHSR